MKDEEKLFNVVTIFYIICLIIVLGYSFYCTLELLS